MRSKVRSDKKELDDKTYVLTFNTLAGAGGFAKPRSNQQSAGLLIAAFGRPTCSNPTSSGTKKDPQPQLRISFGGSWWIRTTEALSSRFTVCPHWPLGNTPIFFCARRADCLYRLPRAKQFVNHLQQILSQFLHQSLQQTRPMEKPPGNQCSRAVFLGAGDRS